MNQLFSIIHPTRRILKAKETQKKWLAAAKQPDLLEYIMVVDNEDLPKEPIEQWVDAYINHGDQTSVGANNCGAAISKGGLLIMMQDDVNEPPHHWDYELRSRLVDRYGENWSEKEIVVGVGCGIHNPNGSSLLTTIIMTRARYEALGYFVHPAFKHTHADDWHSFRAFADGVLFDLRREIIWRHHRCAEGDDAVYQRASSSDWYAHGHRTLEMLRHYYAVTGKDRP